LLCRLWTTAGRPTGELDTIIAAGGAPNLDGYALGELLGFTFADYQAFGAAGSPHPSTIRPIDATKAEIKAYLDDHRKPRQNRARTRRYAERKARRSRKAREGCRSGLPI
jgi:hypothetical protein